MKTRLITQKTTKPARSRTKGELDTGENRVRHATVLPCFALSDSRRGNTESSTQAQFQVSYCSGAVQSGSGPYAQTRRVSSVRTLKWQERTLANGGWPSPIRLRTAHTQQETNELGTLSRPASYHPADKQGGSAQQHHRTTRAPRQLYNTRTSYSNRPQQSRTLQPRFTKNRPCRQAHSAPTPA